MSAAPDRFGVFGNDGPLEYGFASMAMAEMVASRWRAGNTPDAYAAQMCPRHERPLVACDDGDVDDDDYWSPEPMSQASAEFMSRQVSS